jgi:hypothetical protein
MATVNSRAIVDEVIAGNGVYPGDEHIPPVVRIVQYENQFDGGIAYGLIYRGEDPMRYFGGACHNPVVIWDRT